MLLIEICSYFIFLLVCLEIFRLFPKVSIALALFSLFFYDEYWINNIADLFLWVKNYSMIVAFIWMQYLKSANKSFENNIIYYSWIIIMIINITEAIVSDFANDNILNAITGVILIFTCPTAKSANFSIDKSNGNLIYDFTLPWIVIYSLWNFTFVYHNYSIFASSHLALLSASLLIGLMNSGLWLQARVLLLAFHLNLRAIFPHLLGDMEVIFWFDEKIGVILQFISLLFALLYFLHSILRKKDEIIIFKFVNKLQNIK